ncbi:thiamine ABC transporter substrate-binding protein [Nocardioides marmorisolisilvae]|uniref:Thiamine ABC transporter substrate-binding protein n=1 Tax=Nocardioides marmorisolisilvae TaxID=1542737 RepID=A0A3N0E076_9ACTN|nr:thiamine ABC transporter substrate-binding protein [Nocardioides marmorisolisilvae]RNL81252.1 thiamine ABC transporter substrate-binding protein [Nocardioides marmorisolisilvae]
MRSNFKASGVLGASLLLIGAVALAGCGSDDSTDTTKVGKTLVVATHNSWAMSKEVMAEFTKETGITVKIATNGDAGELTNKLVLTKDDPIADGVYGIDNTFATRAVDAGVLAKYRPLISAASVKSYALPGDGASYLTPIDYSDVCVNVDDTWFAKKKLAPPTTLDDLAAPAYKSLTVTEGAKTSSTGLAFLLATIGKYGDDGWQDYWKKLVANDLKVDKDWENAYEVDFTAGGGKGDRPIVVSYSSSPPFTIPKGASKPTTSALLDTCFRQVEFAGVLKGSKNPLGMQKFIDFMSQRSFQEALPDNMYVYPVDSTVTLPAGWDTFAPVAPHPYVVPPADITANRDTWLSQWSDVTGR